VRNSSICSSIDRALITQGAHCVRIENAEDFFKATTAAMKAHHEVTAAFIDYITYRERTYEGVEDSPIARHSTWQWRVNHDGRGSRGIKIMPLMIVAGKRYVSV
jgi:hypothetical protein